MAKFWQYLQEKIQEWIESEISLSIWKTLMKPLKGFLGKTSDVDGKSVDREVITIKVRTKKVRTRKVRTRKVVIINVSVAVVLVVGFGILYLPITHETNESPPVQPPKNDPGNDHNEPPPGEEPPPVQTAMPHETNESPPVQPVKPEPSEPDKDKEQSPGKELPIMEQGKNKPEKEPKMKERDILVKKFPAGTILRDCDTCPELVVVPPGSFTMGSPASEEGRHTDEGPRHRVTIEQPFAVGKYEVTRGEYAQFVLDTEHSTTPSCRIYEDEGEWNERSGHDWQNPGYRQTERDPVVCVSWEDAQEYVLWLSKKTGKAYRLLSEAEWEYVARAGTTTRYTWGDEIGQNRAHCDGCGSRWDSKRTSPVGSFVPNGFGLHDMHGNVWEWVADCWNRSYEGAPSDGSAWESVACKLRVVRGGSWDSSPALLRSADRFGLASDSRYSIDGFRVACTLTL